MAYNSPKYLSPNDIRRRKDKRKKRKSDGVIKGMNRSPDKWPDMGKSRNIFRTGFDYAKPFVIDYLNEEDLPTIAMLGLGPRRGAMKTIKERGYRHVQIKDKDQKNMDGLTGFLTQYRPNMYVIKLKKPVGNISVYYTDDTSKFIDVPTSTKDSAHTTRVNKNALELAMKRQEEMCDHMKPTCLQKVLTFLGFSSKFTARKNSVKKTHKKSVKKASKKTPKKSVKKASKKSIKKTPKKSVKKAPKKM